MKIKEGYLLKEIVGNFVVVPVGAVDFDGMISLNESGVFLWKQLENDIDIETLLSRFLEEYEIDEKTARADLDAFISKMRAEGLIYEP